MKENYLALDGQERRQAGRKRVTNETHELLIRIDERTSRMEKALFGQDGDGGLDKRLRNVEQDNAATKAQAGLIAFVISALIAGIGLLIGKR